MRHRRSVLNWTARLSAAAALACAAFAQAPAFEVVSVKPSEPITPAMVQAGQVNIGLTIDSLHVRINKFSLYDLTTLAYQIKPYQLAAPDWMAAQRYDVQARLPEGGRRGQVPAMLQTMLADRFGMVIHREMRERRVYALVAAKGGTHLTRASETAAAASDAPPGQIRASIAVAPAGKMASTGSGGNWKITPSPGGNLHIENSAMTLATFADFINRYCEDPVIDMTGIQGLFDMEFDVSGDEVRSAARAHGTIIAPRPANAPAEAASDPSGVSLASSLQRLGLKLEPRKVPLEVIVVDKASKVPTEN